jgi:hypothetical protein
MTESLNIQLIFGYIVYNFLIDHCCEYYLYIVFLKYIKSIFYYHWIFNKK